MRVLSALIAFALIYRLSLHPEAKQKAKKQQQRLDEETQQRRRLEEEAQQQHDRHQPIPILETLEQKRLRVELAVADAQRKQNKGEDGYSEADRLIIERALKKSVLPSFSEATSTASAEYYHKKRHGEDEYASAKEGGGGSKSKEQVYVWCCDYCKAATFATFAEAALHEEGCSMRLEMEGELADAKEDEHPRISGVATTKESSHNTEQSKSDEQTTLSPGHSNSEQLNILDKKKEGDKGESSTDAWKNEPTIQLSEEKVATPSIVEEVKPDNGKNDPESAETTQLDKTTDEDPAPTRWRCDYCMEATYDTFDEALAHEKVCEVTLKKESNVAGIALSVSCKTPSPVTTGKSKRTNGRQRRPKKKSANISLSAANSIYANTNQSPMEGTDQTIQTQSSAEEILTDAKVHLGMPNEEKVAEMTPAASEAIADGDMDARDSIKTSKLKKKTLNMAKPSGLDDADADTNSTITNKMKNGLKSSVNAKANGKYIPTPPGDNLKAAIENVANISIKEENGNAATQQSTSKFKASTKKKKNGSQQMTDVKATSSSSVTFSTAQSDENTTKAVSSLTTDRVNETSLPIPEENPMNSLPFEASTVEPPNSAGAQNVDIHSMGSRLSALASENESLKAENEVLKRDLLATRQQTTEAVQRVQLKSYIADTARDAAEERAAKLEAMLVDAVTQMTCKEVVQLEVNDAFCAAAYSVVAPIHSMAPQSMASVLHSPQPSPRPSSLLLPLPNTLPSDILQQHSQRNTQTLRVPWVREDGRLGASRDSVLSRLRRGGESIW